jgi:hypothetical protein
VRARLVEARVEVGEQPLERLLRRELHAHEREARGPARRDLWREGARGQVEADAAHEGRPRRVVAARLDQDAGELGAVQEHVVGPLEACRGEA